MSALAPQGVPQSIMVGGDAGPGGPAGPGLGGPGPADPADPTGASPSPGSSTNDGDWEEDLQNALAALRELAGDAEDHVETNIIDKCIAALSALTAKRQQGHESALGVTPAHKAMSRSYGG